MKLCTQQFHKKSLLKRGFQSLNLELTFAWLVSIHTQMVCNFSLTKVYKFIFLCFYCWRRETTNVYNQSMYTCMHLFQQKGKKKDINEWIVAFSVLWSMRWNRYSSIILTSFIYCTKVQISLLSGLKLITGNVHYRIVIDSGHSTLLCDWLINEVHCWFSYYFIISILSCTFSLYFMGYWPYPCQFICAS